MLRESEESLTRMREEGFDSNEIEPEEDESDVKIPWVIFSTPISSFQQYEKEIVGLYRQVMMSLFPISASIIQRASVEELADTDIGLIIREVSFLRSLKKYLYFSSR